MKKRLYLTSAGLPSENVADFLEFYGKDPHGDKVAFIPTATNSEEDASWVDNVRKELTDLGFILTEVDIEKIHGQELADILEKQDVIFVNGGNTFYLLYWAKISGFNKITPNLLNQGKVYIGLSAGTILVGQSVETAEWKGFDDPSVVKLENWHGLGLVNFNLFVHYDPKYRELIDQKKLSLKTKLICLTDQQAVAVIDDQYKIVGPGEKLELK